LFQKKSKGYFGGAELQMSLIVKQLAKDKRFEVSLMTGDYGQKRVIKKGRLTIYRCFDKGKRRSFELIKIFLLAWRINADVYVGRTANKMINLTAWFGGVFNKKIVYMMAHDWDSQLTGFSKRSSVNRKLFHQGLKKVDLVMAQTKKQQKRLEKNFGKPSVLMRSLAKPTRLKKRLKRDLILWVGRSDDWKRSLSFIKLAQALLKERFVMVCRQGNDANLFYQASNLAVEQDNLKFYPVVSIEEIIKLFQRAKIFVNTSTAEGFPNTFLQSGLVKTPVLSLKVNPDNYLNQFNCGLVAKNSQKLLVKYCRQLIKNSQLRKIMGKNHYDYVRKNHSLKNVEIFKQAIEKLILEPKGVEKIINDFRGKASYRWDKFIIEEQYFRIFKKPMNWNNPQTYPEKMQILKIQPEAEKLWIYTDKYEVRKYVKKVVGKQYLNKVYGVYKKPEEINLKSLPNKFALKPTHLSGPVIICKNKAKLDWKKTKKELNRWLKINYYRKFKEKSYKLIKPRIICEKLLRDKQDNYYDYKFFCFHGQPKLIQVDLDRYINHTQNFYTPSWRKVPIKRCFPVFKKKLGKPKDLDKMLEIASVLSAGFPHVRVDLYNLDGQILFGELTFSSFAGYPAFKSEKYNRILGSYLIYLSKDFNVGTKQ